MNKKAMIALMGLAAAGFASAATIDVTDDIVTSTKWTADNTYDLKNQIYVRSGASLTIEAGTRVATSAGSEHYEIESIETNIVDEVEVYTTNWVTVVDEPGSGSIAVCRGARIYVNGTRENPVVMTSASDTNGTAQVLCNTWGNLTLMGRGVISAASDTKRPRPDNTKSPTGLNEVQMEGLTADGTNDVFYGGADDNDDSGSIKFLSLRYGGKVIGLNNELNGLSMGGIGRETDVDYVDIFCNVDDGIETWGGAVNYKHISIWNIGDDSFDIDQGWRGKAQFGLIVQGYSDEAKQGSGVGDNCFEHDGAENSDASPATSGKIANFTVIGQPYVSGDYEAGDGATVWRDNCRMQYANMIFMDIGDHIVRIDGNDGDGSLGYSYALTGVAYTDDEAASWTNEVAAFESLWALSYTNYYADNFTNSVYSSVADMYPAQTSGYLCEIRNSVINNAHKVDNATDVGVFNAEMNNTVASDLPIKAITRGTPAVFVASGKTYLVAPVTSLNPCADNDAVDVGAGVEADDFFTHVTYAGGFSPNYNWLEGWTAAYEYGLTDTSDNETAAPAAAITVGAAVSFQSEDGLTYAVQHADTVDGAYTTVSTVVGDGSTMTYVDEDLASSGFYKVVVQ